MIEIKPVTEVTQPIVEALTCLITQLAPDVARPSQEDLETIVNTPNTYLFLAYNPAIVGSLTLIVNRMPTGTKVWIEDVVVDASARKQRIGEQLVQYAIDFAIGKGIKSINLTSTPSRVAANELYKKLGFVQRDTNVYRLVVE